AGAEIVDRDPNPQVAQLSKSARALLWFIQESALQNFDPQPFGSEAALFEGRKYVVDESWVLDMGRRDVDIDRGRRIAKRQAPARCVGACPADGPLAHRNDQAHLLGDR